MAKTHVGADAAPADGGSNPRPLAAGRLRTGGFTGGLDRRVQSCVLAARNCGGSEVRLEPDGTVVVVVKHSKDCIPAAVTMKEETLLAGLAAQQRRQQEWLDKQAAAGADKPAPAKPSKNARKHAREREKRREIKRELEQMRDEKRQQQPQQQEEESAMEEDPAPPPQQQQSQSTPTRKFVRHAPATAPAGAGSVPAQGLLKQAIERITQLAPKCDGFGPAKTRDRYVVLPGDGERLPVTVKANTKGARWNDKEFGERLSEALRGVRAEQLQEALMKFVNEQLDTTGNSGGEVAPTFGGPAFGTTSPAPLFGSC